MTHLQQAVSILIEEYEGRYVITAHINFTIKKNIKKKLVHLQHE